MGSHCQVRATSVGEEDGTFLSVVMNYTIMSDMANIYWLVMANPLYATHHVFHVPAWSGDFVTIFWHTLMWISGINFQY